MPRTSICSLRDPENYFRSNAFCLASQVTIPCGTAAQFRETKTPLIELSTISLANHRAQVGQWETMSARGESCRSRDCCRETLSGGCEREHCLQRKSLMRKALAASYMDECVCCLCRVTGGDTQVGEVEGACMITAGVQHECGQPRLLKDVAALVLSFGFLWALLQLHLATVHAV
jgi:hypothetical protein